MLGTSLSPLVTISALIGIIRLSSGGSSYSQTLSALGLLLCCVYTGEEGESLIGVTMDTTTLARERITCILEWWVCHGSCDRCVIKMYHKHQGLSSW